MILRITAYLLFQGISEIYSGEAKWPRVKISGGSMIRYAPDSLQNAPPPWIKSQGFVTRDLSLKLKLTTLPNEQPKR